MSFKYPLITPKLLSGQEHINFNGLPTGLTLLDFWKWQGSNLVDNSIRGILAEFLVTQILKCEKQPRIEWDGFDCITQEGIKIEVKTSAYIQSWGQHELSKIVFDVAPKKAWEAKSNTYSSAPKRHADVYVFCVHSHTVQGTVDPLNLDQWDFYALATKRLNDVIKTQKSISFTALMERFSPTKLKFDTLQAEVITEASYATPSKDT